MLAVFHYIRIAFPGSGVAGAIDKVKQNSTPLECCSVNTGCSSSPQVAVRCLAHEYTYTP